jgi:hypothetical protein
MRLRVVTRLIAAAMARYMYWRLSGGLPYGEPRFITAGRLDERMVVIAWTPRGIARRVTSMRKANE